MLNKRFFSFLIAGAIAISAFAGFTVSLNNANPTIFRMAANGQVKPGDTVNFSIVNNTEDENFQFTVYRVAKEQEFITEYLAARTYGRFDIWKKDGTYLQFCEKVKEFNRIVTPSGSYYYEPTILSAGTFDKPGIYIIKAISAGKVAYLPIYISEKMMVMKKGDKNFLSFVTNAKTGEILMPDLTTLYADGKTISSQAPTSEGLTLMDLSGVGNLENKSSLITALVAGELVYSDPYIFFGGGEGKRYFSTIYTNQPVYRPGATVSYKGIIRFREDGEMGIPSGSIVEVKITDPSGTEVLKENLKIDDFGSFYSSFNTSKGFKPGNYYINASFDGNYFYSTFTLEEYKKPEYKVVVTTSKDACFNGEEITGTVQSDYYFGQPVAGASVKVRVLRKPYRIPWWFGSDYSWYYKSWYAFDYGNYEYIKELKGTLNAEGSWSFSYMTPDDSTSGYTYMFEANVTDAALREIKGSTSINSSVTDFIITASCDKYYVNPGSEITITAKTYNNALLPIEKEVSLLINKTTYFNGTQITETLLKDELKTNEKGIGFYNFKPSAEGWYNVTIMGRGSNGRLAVDQTSFYCFSGGSWYGYGESREAQIITDKEAYIAGDTVKALIYLPNKLTQGVVTIEQNSIISATKINLKDGFAEYSFVTGKNFYPGFNITFAGTLNSTFIYAAKKVGVINEDARLNVQITPSKEKYKPGEEAEYVVKVTDKNGKAVKNAQLSFGSVDESIYAIKADNSTPVYESFYRDEYYYTQNNTSLDGKYGQAMSRPVTLFDQKYDPSDQASATTGSSKIEIKFKLKDADEKVEELEIMITNGSVLKRDKASSKTFTTFSNLPEGEYDICLALYNSIYPLKRIYVGKGKTVAEEIALEPFIDDIEFYFSGNMAGGIDGMTKSSADNFSIQEEAAVAPNTRAADKKDMEVDVRENFVDAPYWNPAIITDGSGEAEISFLLPDNLTSWRSTVKVVTKETHAGESINNVFATKDLLIRTETSRFFKEGDSTMVIANIHNYLDSDAKTKVKFNFTNLNITSFDVKGVQISKKTANSFETVIPPKGVATIEIKTSVPFNSYSSELYFEAISDKESDAVRINLPVVPVGVKSVNYLNAVIQSNETEKTIEFNIPQGVNLKTVNLSLALSPTIATTLLNSLDGLVDYPYGCVEQTMSRFLPALIASSTMKKLDVKLNTATLEKLPDVIAKGLERLYDFQNKNGGWGWWKNDPLNPYMTAYVMYGLKMANDLGYNVDKNVYNSGFEALSTLLAEKNIDRVTAAYIAYIYSLADSNAVKNPAFVKLADELMADSLNAYATSLLGLVHHKLGDKKSEKVILNRLMAMANEDQNFISWGRDKYYTWQQDKVQTTAFALKFLIAVDPNSPVLVKAVKTLIREQKGRGWHSTQQTATAIFALTDYLVLTNELDPEFTAEVIINGKSFKKVSFEKDKLTSPDALISLNSSNFNFIHGKNTIKLVKKGKGTLYAGSDVELYYPDLSFVKENSFNITKEVFKLKEVVSGNTIVYRKTQFDKAKSGEMLLIKLKVKTNRTDDQYMMVEDMLPAGFELVKDDHLYNIEGESSHTGYWPGYWNYFYADKEIRDSKITFFVTYAPQEMEFSYIIRAQAPGFYSSAPVYAGLMYYPEIRGYGNRTLFRITND